MQWTDIMLSYICQPCGGGDSPITQRDLLIDVFFFFFFFPESKLAHCFVDYIHICMLSTLID